MEPKQRPKLRLSGTGPWAPPGGEELEREHTIARMEEERLWDEIGLEGAHDEQERLRSVLGRRYELEERFRQLAKRWPILAWFVTDDRFFLLRRRKGDGTGS